jgi:lipoate synthase
MEDQQMATPDEKDEGQDAFDDFVRTLRAYTPSMTVEGLAAALDVDDLEKIAAELDESRSPTKETNRERERNSVQARRAR